MLRPVFRAKFDDRVKGTPAVGLASINIGDTLPSYTLKNKKDESIDVSNLTMEKGLVLFLISKMDTGQFAPLYLTGALLTIISWMHDTSLWVPVCLSCVRAPGLQGGLPQC